MSLSMLMSIKNFYVTKIAKLLRRPRGRNVIKSQCQEKTGEKEMFSDVDGRQTEKKMLGCRMATLLTMKQPKYLHKPVTFRQQLLPSSKFELKILR